MQFPDNQSETQILQAGPNTFSLSLLFQAVTACGLFFALFQFQPLTTILLTLLLTPCIIRTILCVRFTRHLPEFRSIDRVRYFLSSFLVVLVTVLTGIVTTGLICTMFGATAIAFELSIDGHSNFAADVFFLGATGGFIFGMGGGLIAATAVVSRIWFWGMPADGQLPMYSIESRGQGLSQTL